MSDQALMLRDDAAAVVRHTEAAEALKETALVLAAGVSVVRNENENAAAVQTQTELQKVIKAARKVSDELTSDAEKFKKRVWKTRDDFLAELNSEMTRVSTLIGDFQTLEQAKARAAEVLRQNELSRIEREKNEALAKATSHEAMDAVQAHYNEVAAQTAIAAPAPIRAEGQVVKTDWEITVTNPYDLAKFHPNCVKIEARLTEIKQLLNDGVAVTGITAKKVTKAGVRLAPERAAINV